jgi:hypothetical protein
MWLFCHTAELSSHIEVDKASLNHGNQVAMVLGHYKSHRASTPAGCFNEIVVIASMILVVRVKDHIGSAV